MFAWELLGRSGFPFAALMTVYVATVAFAVWCQGGVSTIFGAIVAYYSVQHVVASQIFKVALGENPESRLPAAIPTIQVEILVMLGFAAAGLLARAIRPNRDRPLFPPINDPAKLQWLAFGATIFAVFRILASGLAGSGSGPLHMLGIVDFLAIAAAVASALTQSDGRRLTSPFVYATAGPILFFSLLGGGRGSILQCALGVFLSAWAFGYRFRLWQYAAGIVAGLIMFFIVSPYSLEVRALPKSASIVQNVNASLSLLGDVVRDPMKYQVDKPQVLAAMPREFLDADYFNLKPGNTSNVLNRFSLIKPTGMIVEDTLQKGTVGWTNISPAFPRLLPGVFGTDKLQVGGTGNSLAHRVKGLVNVEDNTTGITLGLTADAFSSFGWYGAFLIPFGFLLLNIGTVKLLARLDLTRNIFGLAIFSMAYHPLSEETIGTWLINGLYNVFLFTVGFFLAVQVSKLAGFPLSPPTPPRLALGG